MGKTGVQRTKRGGIIKRNHPLRSGIEYERLSQNGRQRGKPLLPQAEESAHRLAAIIEYVVNPASSGSIRCEESTVDQSPEVEAITVPDNVRISTNVDAAPRGCGLLRFVERWVEFQISGGVEGAICLYVEGMTIRCNVENDFIGWKAGSCPSFHCLHSRPLWSWRT